MFASRVVVALVVVTSLSGCSGSASGCGTDFGDVPSAEVMLLDEGTGSITWRTATPHTIDSQISISAAGGRDVLIAGASGSDGERTGGFAVDLATGVPVWGDTGAANGLASYVVNGVLIDQLFENGTQLVRGRSVVDGGELWRHEGFVNPRYRQPDGSADGLVVLADWPATNTVSALEPSTGEIRWTAPIDGEPPHVLFNTGGIYAFNVDATSSTAGAIVVTRLDPATGTTVWQHSIDGASRADDAFVGDETFVAVIRRPDGFVERYVALSTTTGEQTSSGPLPPETSLLALSDAGLISATQRTYDTKGETSAARLTDLRTGTTLWERPAPSTTRIQPTPWGVLFATIETDTSTVLELVDPAGATVWRWSAPSLLGVSAIAATTTSLIVSMLDGTSSTTARGGVAAIDPATGTTTWQQLTGLPVEQPPVVSDAGIVIEQRDPIVYCE